MRTVSPFTSILLFFLFLLFPLPCFAALIILTPGSNGAYELKADDLNSVTALDISIDYDPTLLSKPRISPSLLAARSNLETIADSPGSLRFTITRQAGAINGSGALAQVQFDSVGHSSDAISGLSVSLTGPQGVGASAETRIEDSVVSGEGGKGTPETLLTLPLPSEATSDEAPARWNGRRGQGARSASAGVTADRSAAMNALPGVLDHFRVLGEGRDLEGLRALFVQGTPRGLRQEPAICLSDGTTHVKLTVSAAFTEQRAPHFVLSGARVVSISSTGASTWTVVVIPRKDVYEASMMVVSESGTTVYPLTVAPLITVDPALPVMRKKKQNKALAAAVRAVRIPGSGELPDHVRRYILTANLLAGASTVHASLRP